MAIFICTGLQFGHCKNCKHDMDNHPEFNGSKNEPEGKYEYLSPVACQMSNPSWINFEALNTPQ